MLNLRNKQKSRYLVEFTNTVTADQSHKQGIKSAVTESETIRKTGFFPETNKCHEIFSFLGYNAVRMFLFYKHS